MSAAAPGGDPSAHCRRLEELLARGLRLHWVHSPARSGSTIFARAIMNAGMAGAVSEPFYPRDFRDVRHDAGGLGFLREGSQALYESIVRLVGDEVAGRHVVCGDMTGHFTTEMFERVLPLASTFTVTLRHPVLQGLSLLERVGNDMLAELGGSKLTRAAVLERVEGGGAGEGTAEKIAATLAVVRASLALTWDNLEAHLAVARDGLARGAIGVIETSELRVDRERHMRAVAAHLGVPYTAAMIDGFKPHPPNFIDVAGQAWGEEAARNNAWTGPAKGSTRLEPLDAEALQPPALEVVPEALRGEVDRAIRIYREVLEDDAYTHL